MTNTNFNVDSFVSSMTSQAKDLVPSDVSQETSDYIISTMDSFLRMAYEAISNDNELNPTNDDYTLLLQILAEWIFHKSVDISRAKLPSELWDNIIQHISFTIFEIVKQAWIRDIAKDVIVDTVAHHVDKCYKEGLQQLLDNKKITKEIFEAAIAESNLDKMADEIKKRNKDQLKKEQERIKEAIKNDEKLDDDVTSINDAMEVAEKYFEQEKKVNDEQEKLKKIRKEYEKKTNKAIDSMIPENMKKTMQKQEESKFGKLFSKHVLGNSVEIFLGFLVICLNSKINLFIFFSVGVFLFLYNHFSTSIAEFIIKYDFSLPTVNFIVYFVSILIIGKIIVSSIMKAIEDDVQKQLKEVEDIKQKMQDLVNPNKQFERLGVDIIDIQVGHKLPCIADPNRGGTLLARTDVLRQELTDKLGYIIPSIRIRDCVSLDLNEYSILIRGNVVASGFVYPNKYMVLADEWDSKVGKVPENVIYGVDPALDTQCYWLNKEDVENHWDNITVVDPVGVIKTHLEAIVIKYVDLILTETDIKKYLILVNSQEETLIDTILQRIELEDIRRIFANLIREEVSVKDIIFVLTRLNYYSKTIKDPIELTEMLRRDLAQQISMKHADKDRNLWVVELDENYTKYLESNVKNTINGQIFDIPQEQINELIEMTATKLMIAHQSIGRHPVVLCSPKFRQALYSTLVKYIPTVVVMSHAEVASNVKVETAEIIESYDIPSYNYLEGNVDNEEFYEQEPLLGRVIDSDGKPLDGGIENYSLEEMFSEIAPADSSEPAPITKIFKTGVRAVDAFITIGCGQKMGVFAQSGCGLSTFLGLILKNSEADINIVSLVVDSVEIAWDFINNCVKSEPYIQRKTIVICSTPLDSAEKIKKNFETAVSLCEYYRDKGKNVLFINDKTEPILNAAEKVAWGNGEPACENDYRLAVTSWYQRLINRCKSNDNGIITTILTTNITSLDKGNAAVNTIRKAAQGHIFLSRKVAEQNIYPAIDVLGSISRYQVNLLDNEQKAANMSVRKILALYREKADFFNSDKYVVGENPQNDLIARKYDEIISFIKQRVADNPSLEETLQGLVQLTSNIN